MSAYMQTKGLLFVLAVALTLSACAPKEEHVLLPAGINVTDTATPWSWGYVNERGEMVIAPQFEEAMPFSEGYGRVTLNGSPCFVDTTGAVHSLPDTLVWADDFHNGFAWVSRMDADGLCCYGIIDTSFAYVVPPTEEEIEGYDYEPPYRDDRYIMNVGEWYLTDTFDGETATTTFCWHTPDGKEVYQWKWKNWQQ